MSKSNPTIKERLSTLEALMEDTREDLAGIKGQVFNEIPHQIENLKKEFFSYKLSNSKWLVGILVSLVLTLIATILNLIK